MRGPVTAAAALPTPALGVATRPDRPRRVDQARRAVHRRAPGVAAAAGGVAAPGPVPLAVGGRRGRHVVVAAAGAAAPVDGGQRALVVAAVVGLVPARRGLLLASVGRRPRRVDGAGDGARHDLAGGCHRLGALLLVALVEVVGHVGDRVWRALPRNGRQRLRQNVTENILGEQKPSMVRTHMVLNSLTCRYSDPLFVSDAMSPLYNSGSVTKSASGNCDA